MPQPDLPVIVVGLGAMGSASLLELARRGVPCLGIDRFVPPHNHGSSHGLTRIIRLCYFEHPDYVPLLRESYDLWHQLQAEARQPLIKLTGGLYIGPPDDPFVAGSLRSALAHNLDHEMLQADEVRRRFPQFVLRDGEHAFYEPTSGVLFPERTISASLDLAARLGASISTGERVLSWSSTSRGVTVRTDRRERIGSRLILSPGPWLPSLLPDLAPRLTVTRQVLVWFEPVDPKPLHTPAMPIWSISTSGNAAYYGFPIFPPSRGNESAGGLSSAFKFALHHPGDITDPDAVDPTRRDAEIRDLTDFVKSRVPAAAGRLLDQRTCMYTNTPDQDFLIDRHPQHEHVVVVSACSGHGFKFAPVVGRAAADLAVNGHTSLPIGFLGYRPALDNKAVGG